MSAASRPLRAHELRSDTRQLIARASRAYSRRTGGLSYPGFSGSDVERYNGRDYVVLRSAEGVLAVYLIGGFDSLVWIEKEDYPEELNANQ